MTLPVRKEPGSPGKVICRDNGRRKKIQLRSSYAAETIRGEAR
jgi:hypothetical protein